MSEHDPIRVLNADPANPVAEPILITEATAVILVPEDAPAAPGRIAFLTASGEAAAKHDLRALAQMALFDFEEGALSPEPVAASHRLIARSSDGETVLERGLLIARDLAGAARAWAHEGIDAKPLFAEAYRYATRWVRLDVR